MVVAAESYTVAGIDTAAAVAAEHTLADLREKARSGKLAVGGLHTLPPGEHMVAAVCMTPA